MREANAARVPVKDLQPQIPSQGVGYSIANNYFAREVLAEVKRRIRDGSSRFGDDAMLRVRIRRRMGRRGYPWRARD